MIPPAQLWIGKPLTLHEQTVKYLQKQFCFDDKCTTCTSCMQIKQQQHHGVMWIQPEKTQYSISTLDQIFTTISFARTSDEPFFFILQKADLLTHQCANSLLKSLEEPPKGYHFILLAEKEDQILPTIASRCITKKFKDSLDASEQSPLFMFFTMPTADPSQFLQLLEKENLTDRQAFDLTETVLEFWQVKYQNSLKKDDEQKKINSLHKIGVITKALEKPPMPGSAKLFLKNLFLLMQS